MKVRLRMASRPGLEITQWQFSTSFPFSFSILNSKLQQARVERQRQEVLEPVRALLFLEIGEHDLEVAAELPQNLPARAARRGGSVGIGDDRDAGEGAMAFGDRLEHRDALGADCQPIGRVLDVAAGDDGAVGGFERRTDLEL